MGGYPSGALHSLIGAVIICVVALLIFLWHEKSDERIGWHQLLKNIWEWFDERMIVKSGLLLATFIAVWLATRRIGLILENLLDESYNYSVLLVLEVIGALLFINLAVTLIKSTGTKKMAEATIQSVIIALLLFLPWATTPYQKESVYYSAAVVLFALSVSLVAVFYVWNRMNKYQFIS